MKNTKLKKSLKTAHIIFALIGIISMTTIVFIPYIPYSLSIKPGERVTKTIYALKTIQFSTKEDNEKTNRLRTERAQLIEKQYSLNEDLSKQMIEDIVSFFTLAKRTSKQNIPNNTDNSSSIDVTHKPLLNKYISQSLSENTITRLEKEVLAITQSTLNNGVTESDIEPIQIAIKKKVRKRPFTQIEKSLITETISHFLRPNIVFDQAKTQAQINKELELIKPFTTIYKKGSPIIYEDEIVNLEHIEIFKALGIYGVQPNIIKFFGIFMVTFFLFLIYERFNYIFTRTLYSKSKYFYLIFFVSLTLIIIARFIQTIPISNHHLNLMFLIPIPLISLISATLISSNIALISGTLVSVIISMMYEANMGVFIFLFLSNCSASLLSHSQFKRTQLIKTGYIIGGLNLIIALSVGLFTEQTQLYWFGYNSSLAFANGILSSMLALALLPYLESLFNITTSQSLLELSNLDHPLLKRLMMTTPGTYQHSIMVANLAEAAAEAINANPILARVGAYYHDIGKMKRPNFYIENQTSDNPHNNLTPRMSKIIIASHPKEGVELAKKYKLPSILHDFMLQHHGTSLVRFFYNQVLQTEQQTDTSNTEQEFRYPGPKPQFKEAGIVMLADVIEATIRSMKQPSPSKIEMILNKSIKDIIDDNQLSECPLSLKEISIIKTTFLNILQGMHHQRINYDDAVDES